MPISSQPVDRIRCSARAPELEHARGGAQLELGGEAVELLAGQAAVLADFLPERLAPNLRVDVACEAAVAGAVEINDLVGLRHGRSMTIPEAPRPKDS
jgi:hypothetical protein